MGRLWTALALALPLLLPALPAQGSFEDGAYVADTLVVGPDQTFVLGPDAVLSGPGRLEVWGRLEVRGESGHPALVAIPVRLLGDQPHRVSHARLWGVNGTALSLENGTLQLDDALFEANGVGLHLAGPVLARGRNVTFRAHADAALSLAAPSRADLDEVRLEEGALGVRVGPGATLRLANASASGNRVHLQADVPPADVAGPRVLLLSPDFGATAPGGAAGIVVQAAPGPAAAPDAPAFEVRGGRLHDAPVALRASGEGLRLRLEGVGVEGNGVGLSLDRVALELTDVRLGNAQDLEGAEGARLLLQNVAYLPRPEAAGAPSEAAWPSWVPWLSMAGVLVVAGAILWTARPRRPAAPTPAPAHEDDPAPAEPAAPAPVAPAPPAFSELGTQERRILEDIVAHPDTAQAAVAERLGLSRQAVHYHVKKLEAKGLIRKTTKGRETQCRAEPGAVAALAPAAVPAEG